MAAANSNTRLVATAAAALRPRRPRSPELQTWALTAHSTGRRRRRRAQAAARPGEGGDAEVAECRRGHVRDPAPAGRRAVRAASEAPGVGHGPRGSPWRPPPRASGRTPPSCGLRQARARATGRRRGPKRTARAPVGECWARLPRPGPPGLRPENCLGLRLRSASSPVGGNPQVLAHQSSEAPDAADDFAAPRLGASGARRNAPAAAAPELGAGRKARLRRLGREGAGASGRNG